MNVLFNFYFLQIFLNKKFYNLGLRWLEAQDDNGKSFSVLTDIFPKMTICPWRQFGSGGEIEQRYFLCLLGTNRITEKIFVFLWFWFVLLAIISTLALIYRIAILSVPSLRVRVIMRKLHNRVNQRIVEDVLSCQNHSWIDQIGDYWVFFLLSKNLPTIAMKELLEDLKPIFNSSTPNGYSKLEKD